MSRVNASSRLMRVLYINNNCLIINTVHREFSTSNGMANCAEVNSIAQLKNVTLNMPLTGSAIDLPFLLKVRREQKIRFSSNALKTMRETSKLEGPRKLDNNFEISF